ncbi:hypothetical protein SDC9_201651 [bioreactor metagenome]|uniref:Uncharacterized protein n=1 Tax=bioreactor metagenome TaxID=1076179 RepID=A0A645IT31_9ZZZZ
MIQINFSQTECYPGLETGMFNNFTFLHFWVDIFLYIGTREAIVLSAGRSSGSMRTNHVDVISSTVFFYIDVMNISSFLS